MEKRLDEKKGEGFKSEAERQISFFLDRNVIFYQYEPPVLVTPVRQRPRIWYPDFYLPQYKSYIEYYGLADREHYRRGIELKNKTYAKMGLDVIPIYSWMFAGKWQRYLLNELEHRTYRQHRNLLNKFRQTGSKPSKYHLNPGYRKKAFYRF